MVKIRIIGGSGAIVIRDTYMTAFVTNTSHKTLRGQSASRRGGGDLIR